MSTENEYTPTIDLLSDLWVDHLLDPLPRREGITLVPDVQAAFDRWLAAHDAEVAAKALEDAAGVAETGDGAEAEAWAGWLHRRAAALRASTGGDPSGYIQIEEHMLSEEGWPNQ